MVLTLTEPNAKHWWVTDSQNTLRWTGTQPTHFSVYISHPDPKVLVGKLILMRQQPLYTYYKIITPYGFKAAAGYIIEFTRIDDPKKIYATSEPFEIHRQGSHRCQPPASVRPSLSSQEQGSSLSRLSNGSTTSVASASVSASRISDGHVTHLTFEYGGAYVAGVHAAGLLCEGFRNVSLQEVEQGMVEGWIKLGTPPKKHKGPTFVVGGGSADGGSIDGSPPLGEPMFTDDETVVIRSGTGTPELLTVAIVGGHDIETGTGMADIETMSTVPEED